MLYARSFVTESHSSKRRVRYDPLSVLRAYEVMTDVPWCGPPCCRCLHVDRLRCTSSALGFGYAGRCLSCSSATVVPGRSTEHSCIMRLSGVIWSLRGDDE